MIVSDHGILTVKLLGLNLGNSRCQLRILWKHHPSVLLTVTHRNAVVLCHFQLRLGDPPGCEDAGSLSSYI